MGFDTLVQGGTVVSVESARALDIGISDGRVVALLEPGHGLTGESVLDASGRFVVPGSIDPHTHIEYPVGRDTFRAMTIAAATGGTTTVIDFIPVPRGESLLRGAEHRVGLAAGKSVVDYSFHPILNSTEPGVMAEIPQLIRQGFASFKIYTTYAGDRLDDGEVWRAIDTIASNGGLPGFHAENHELLERVSRDLVAAGRVAMTDFPGSRPAEAEAEAIRMVAYFARRLGSPVYIYHLSGAVPLESLLEARAEGARIRAETCTHYLAFDDSVFSGPDAWRYVITPPIRSAASQERLWEGVADGSLSAVASDHCGYGTEHKAAGREDFTKLPPGAPGIDARVPFLWSLGVSAGRLTVTDFVRVASTEPAKTLGLYPRKGSLQPGSDADLVVIDPDEEWEFPAPNPDGGSDYSLYAGMRLKGRPRLTMVRGEVVVRDGVFVGREGSGVFVPQAIDTSWWR